MAEVLVIGGGPAGLSAALFTAKNGLETAVFDTDTTWMHKAHLFNYPGIGSVDGSNYLATLRDQVDDFGVERHQGTDDVDVTMETSVEDAYATGAMVRVEEWQAVISAGDGAAAALNVLSKEKGEHYHDFDVPADADELFGSLVDTD